MKKAPIKRLRWILVSFGLLLIITPFLLPLVLPRPDLQHQEGAARIAGRAYASAAPISSLQDERIVRLEGEPALLFARRATLNLHAATYHCAYNSVWHNWLTAILRDRLPGLNEYGLLSLERMRCGYCHQRAFLLAKILRYGGIPEVAVLSIGAHVVTTFTIDGKRYAADADFGVGPFHFGYDEGSLRRVVESVYRPVASDFGESMSTMIVGFYINDRDHVQYHYGTLMRVAAAQEDVLRWQDRIEAAVVAFGTVLAVLGASLGWLVRPRMQSTRKL